MIDESIDISITYHLIVFASSVEERFLLCVFLRLLHIEEKNACILFATLTKNIKV